MRPQPDAVWDFLLGRATEADLVAAIGSDPRSDPEYLPARLAEAAHDHDADAVEAALALMDFFDQFGRRDVPLLGELLVAGWHTRHEDVAGLLQRFADPASVPALHRCAELDLPYRAHDDRRALSRKCMWALSDIRTDEAVTALEQLTQSPDATVRELAAHHLAKVRNDEPVSRRRRLSS